MSLRMEETTQILVTLQTFQKWSILRMWKQSNQEVEPKTTRDTIGAFQCGEGGNHVRQSVKPWERVMEVIEAPAPELFNNRLDK